MKIFEIWEKIGEAESVFTKLLRYLLLLVCAVSLFFFAVLPLTWPQQVVLGCSMFLVALWLGRFSNSYLITLVLMLMSIFASFRYGWWRISTVITYLRDPMLHWGALDIFFIVILVLAETYAVAILMLGYFQTIWPLHRAPLPLPDNADEWPEVDLLIPTYNEPLSVVRHTALASLNIDWPVEKLHVYLLDDGRREEFRKFAEEAGIGYMTREDNKGAKAGNINNALSHLHSPYVAIFDCDHVPTRSFLQVTMGWFLKDRKLALMQTPHHFYSPDPFERNLDQFKAVPSEEELFYGVVQDGNDFWNSTFFCGSCAVLRREALDQVGGIATETVTEDAHTSLRLQMKGWNTAYINIPQAAGLATERLAGHVTQRIRWARGMIQILRTDNPLFARGLKWSQRLCYFNAMMHFLYALPRLIFLTAPLIYLILGHSNIPGHWAAILAYALPHLFLSNITNSRVQGQHRHSFWNEVYETVLAPYILLPTLFALVNPKFGKFNVTAKGGTVKETYFDTKIAQPFFVLLLFNVIGLIMAALRFFVWDVAHPGTVVMNTVWVFFNIVILGVATAVARESKQRRQDVRIDLSLPSRIQLADGSSINGKTVDVSSGGTAIRIHEQLSVTPGAAVRVLFPLPGGVANLPSTVIGNAEGLLRLHFEDLSIEEQEQLTRILYSRADSWLGWGENREPDKPLRSLYRIFRLAIHGLAQSVCSLFARSPKESGEKELTAPQITSILLLAVLFGGLGTGRLYAAPDTKISSPAAQESIATGSFHENIQLKDAGVAKAIELRGLDSSHTVFFALSDTHVVKEATLHLRYQLSPTLLPQLSQLKLMLNGTLFATLPMPQKVPNTFLEQTIPVPADLLVRYNKLTFEFVGHYALGCEDASDPSLWSRIDNATYLDLSGSLLPLINDLKLLPVPFLESALIAEPSITVAFAEQPSSKSLQAAGVVASYFGMIADPRPIRFPTSVGDFPTGNIVVIAPHASGLPAVFHMGEINAPTIAIRPNPKDAYAKVLIVTGKDDDQLLMAAQSLAINSTGLHGETVTVSQFTLPAPPQADVSPRWAQTDQPTPLWDDPTTESLQSDGSVPLNTYLRIPPDLYYGDRSRVLLHLNYLYNAVPLGYRSAMVVRANRAYLGAIPLVPGKETAQNAKADVSIPVMDLRPFSNSLAFEFNFQWSKEERCQTAIPADMQGSILRDSYLDLRGLRHYTALPNLEIFANAGFPFTRYADLHETTVVMPASPAPEAIELFLSLMAHFGAQTGFPVLRVTVDNAGALRAGADRDFLVLGSAVDQPAFDKLADSLPVVMVGGQAHVQERNGVLVFLNHLWWMIRNWDGDKSSAFDGGSRSEALIEGIESPYSQGRSIVIIEGRETNSYNPILSTFLKVSQSGDIAKSVSILRGTEFKSFWLGENRYYVGSLPLWSVLSLWFVQVPWMVALLVPPICLLLAVWIRIELRRHARIRLQVAKN